MVGGLGFWGLGLRVWGLHGLGVGIDGGEVLEIYRFWAFVRVKCF